MLNCYKNIITARKSCGKSDKKHPSDGCFCFTRILHQAQSFIPPSTVRSMPVMYLPSSEQSSRAAPAQSSAFPA